MRPVFLRRFPDTHTPPHPTPTHHALPSGRSLLGGVSSCTQGLGFCPWDQVDPGDAPGGPREEEGRLQGAGDGVLRELTRTQNTSARPRTPFPAAPQPASQRGRGEWAEVLESARWAGARKRVAPQEARWEAGGPLEGPRRAAGGVSPRAVGRRGGPRWEEAGTGHPDTRRSRERRNQGLGTTRASAPPFRTEGRAWGRACGRPRATGVGTLLRR